MELDGPDLPRPTRSAPSTGGLTRGEAIARPWPQRIQPLLVLSPKEYRALDKKLRGDFEKVLLEGPGQRRFLFKPDQVKIDSGYGKFEVEARRALAYERLARIAGVDTPAMRMAQYQGRIGSLQEWRNAMTRAEILLYFRSDFERITSHPNYVASLQRMELLDAVANNTDRLTNKNNWNHLIDPTDRHAIAIDNDMTFAVDGYVEPMQATAVKEELLELLLHNSSSIAEALAPYLTEPEVDAVQRRLGNMRTRFR